MKQKVKLRQVILADRKIGRLHHPNQMISSDKLKM